MRSNEARRPGDQDAHASHHAHRWDRHDESPAEATTILRLLIEDLVRAGSNCEQQHVVRHARQQAIGRRIGKRVPGSVAALLSRIAVDDEVEHVCPMSERRQQRRAFAAAP